MDNHFSQKSIIVAVIMILASLCLSYGEDSWTGPVMHLGEEGLEGFEDFTELAANMGSTWGIVLIVSLVVLLDPRNRRAIVELIGGMVFVTILNMALKLIISRQRPAFDRRNAFVRELSPENSGRWFCYRYSDWEFLKESFVSYPSGHSAAAAFLAQALSRHYPRATAVWWILAVGAMTDRFISARHYISDIIAGAAVGILCFEFIHHRERMVGWSKSLRRRFAKGEDAKWTVSPPQS